MSGIAFSRLAGLAGLYLEIAWSIHRGSYGKASNVHIPMILRIWSKSVQFSQCYVYFILLWWVALGRPCGRRHVLWVWSSLPPLPGSFHLLATTIILSIGVYVRWRHARIPREREPERKCKNQKASSHLKVIRFGSPSCRSRVVERNVSISSIFVPITKTCSCQNHNLM